MSQPSVEVLNGLKAPNWCQQSSWPTELSMVSPLPHQVRPLTWIERRDMLLLSLANDAVVLDIGCCNAPRHLPRARAGALLNQRLKQAARRVVGIDNNREALTDLRAMGLEDLYETESAPDLDYDLGIAGEVIEHVTNLDGFFGQLARYRIDMVVFSTPNAIYYRRWFSALRGRDIHHEDHTAIYTPMLLCQVLERYGYEPSSVHTTSLERLHEGAKRPPSPAARALCRFFPLFGETVLVVAKRKNESASSPSKDEY